MMLAVEVGGRLGAEMVGLSLFDRFQSAGGTAVAEPRTVVLDSSRVIASQKCQQSQGSGGRGREAQNCRHFWPRLWRGKRERKEEKRKMRGEKRGEKREERRERKEGEERLEESREKRGEKREEREGEREERGGGEESG